jgi:hydroxysqualene synthase
MERARSYYHIGFPMTGSAELRSGKGSGDENFPVASRIIHRRHRPVVLAFYEFVRIADDIADHATLDQTEKLARLDRLEGSLLAQSNEDVSGVILRRMLQERGLSPVHAQQLLNAFRQDVIKLRYANWDELMDSCRLSAMPVGRFVLDVHGESRSTWPASDALCAALQIINHLQDCSKDYRELNRVYIPLDALAADGLGVDALGYDRASPALVHCLQSLADRTGQLLAGSHELSTQVGNLRLAMEISVIQRLAERLVAILQVRDPLSEKVHLTKPRMLLTIMAGAAAALSHKFMKRMIPSPSAAD